MGKNVDVWGQVQVEQPSQKGHLALWMLRYYFEANSYLQVNNDTNTCHYYIYKYLLHDDIKSKY